MALSAETWLRLSDSPFERPALRASDGDRGVVFDALGEAYAAGLIDSDEHAQRLEAAGDVKTLGDILPLLQDLVAPDAGPTGRAGQDGALAPTQQDRGRLAQLRDDEPTTPEEIDEAARAHARSVLLASALGWVGPSVLCVAIWAFSQQYAGGVFFWPLFVIFGTGFGFFGTLAGREKMIRERKRKLTTRARARLGDAQAQREIEANPRAFDLDDATGTREARRRARRERRGRA
ncbi:DUF1707 domain-containing protein [Brevibacterium sp. 5221]|uniref:DUF1707 domain-containing protein n=1 Tax=Brevibacterium rongguiense TaxID=2695267 RepID=A0A6N9H9D9_9MICO|nr:MULTISPECIES: DUF1707 domain-containing protein [Brevibacterium]MYM20710.1 DUF1707 domain-containing protein [Brevibacterium rongguiense]WAL40034.1 DUF1707 domain-containing protein [Brevibacterium sp. BRM-1]